MGPAGYNVTKPKSCLYSYSMAGKLENIAEKKNRFTPGPGMYELQHLDNKNMRKSPSFGMGSETRDRNPHMKEQKTVPGAGTYATTFDMKAKSPSFGFGSSKRPQMGAGRENSPGPGAYKLPSKVADVAPYTGIKTDHKHV
jgi:hypothetical protein